MIRNNCVGIDIGLKGGICILRRDGTVQVHCMPTYKDSKGKKQIDVIKLKSILKGLGKAVIGIEPPQARGGISSKSIGTSFKNFGKVQAILDLLKYSQVELVPVVWQKIWTIENTQDLEEKERSIQLCKNVFPEVNLLATARSTVPHDGIADAICIAYYLKYFSNA